MQGEKLISSREKAFSGRIFRGRHEEPHIIFFPSEYDRDQDIGYLAEGLTGLGMTLIAFEYGEDLKAALFGLKGPGHLMEKAGAAFKALKIRLNEDKNPGPLVVMGRSLGSSIALDLSVKEQEAILCLIMESAFDKADAFSHAPEKDPFNNRKMMAGLKKPVLFLHSSRDELVSLTEIEWLVAESRSKATQFKIVPSPSRENLAPSTGEFYFKSIRDFIYLRMGRRPKRRKRSKTAS